MKQSNRIIGLDIVRAFAILFVLFGHGRVYLKDYVNMRTYNNFILDGVSIFFVLSGFLIGGIFLKTVESAGFTFADIGTFWKRRWFRTLPNYYLILTLLAVITVFYYKTPIPNIWRFYLFVQNFNSRPPGFFPEAWSLAVEEWFYLLIPASIITGLFLFREVSKKKVILSVICFVLIGCTCWRIYKAYQLIDTSYVSWDLEIRKQVLCELDSIVYGFFAAFVLFYYADHWYRYKNFLFAIGIIGLLFGATYFTQTENIFYRNYFLLPVDSICAMLILPKMNSVIRINPAVDRAATFVSTISYSMYLVNLTLIQDYILEIILRHMHIDISRSIGSALTAYFMFIVITFLLSYIIYSFYEKKMTSLRDLYGKRDNVK